MEKNSIFGAYLAIGMNFMLEMKQQSENWKQRIRDDWERSKNYPRKKKKRVRKELLLDWQIACWNPFD